MDYVVDCTHKQLLDSLSTSYCLCSAVQFYNKTQNKSHVTIDNICMAMFTLNNFTLYPIINRLSDHDAQYIIICNIFEKKGNADYYLNCKPDKFSIMDYITRLSYELRENLFTENNVTTTFNHFLNTYFRIFYSSFPRTNYKPCDKAWLTSGIKI
jgi:hypothetical protein